MIQRLLTGMRILQSPHNFIYGGTCMIVAIILIILIAILFLYIGFLLRKKEKITLLHDYHRNHVSEEDKKAFCRLSGLGVIFIGMGLLISAIILLFTDSAWSFLAFAAGFIAGLMLLIHAGNKYNVKKG